MGGIMTSAYQELKNMGLRCSNSMEDAVKMRKHILSCEKAAKNMILKAIALLTLQFGAGFTGVELVGELMDWIPVLAHK